MRRPAGNLVLNEARPLFRMGLKYIQAEALTNETARAGRITKSEEE
jgi:YD repeat-containing protein